MEEEKHSDLWDDMHQSEHDLSSLEMRPTNISFLRNKNSYMKVETCIQDNVENLDEFYRDLYGYYRERTIGSVLANVSAEFVIMLFTALLSSGLFVAFDWHAFLKCDDEESCKPLVDYRTISPAA